MEARRLYNRFLDPIEEQKLRDCLAQIGLDNYYDWILSHKSYTEAVNGELIKLDLSWHGLQWMPEGFLKEFDHLAELRLDNNPNCRFEEGALASDSLQRINMRYCKLNKVPIHALRGMPHLQEINVDHNRITAVERGDFTTLDQLIHLRLSNNRIFEIAENGFHGLSQLRLLNLSNNQLDDLKQYTFTGLGNVTKLYLQFNQLNDLLVGAFDGLGSLISLILDNNHIEKIEAGTLADLYYLDELSIAENKITGLGTTFANLNCLSKINLQGNRIEKLEIKNFAESHGITILELPFNDIKRIEPKTFSTMPHLEIINIQDNPLEIEAALNLPSQALYNYRNYLQDLDSDELYELICEYYKNRRLVDQALADELADEKIHAFLRLVGYFTGNE